MKPLLTPSVFLQTEPRLKVSSLGERSGHPLLHLPLTFPSKSTLRLTGWSTINLHLPSFLPHFSSLARGFPPETIDSFGTLPSGKHSHVSYVRVYATCRLRRIWFSEGGPSRKLPWEFNLYCAE
jgi:hypothetical protein